MSHVHLGDLAIAKLLLGRSDAPADAIACPVCRGAVDQARREAASFARLVCPRTLPSIEARLARRRVVWFTAAGLAAAAAFALVWLAIRSPGGSTGPVAGATSERAVIAAKGGPTLHVMARHAAGSRGHVFEIEDGAELAAGDAIRFVLDAEGGRYALVVSVDGAGKLSVYHPYGGEASAPIDAAARRIILPGSIVLDDAPGPERIWAVISDRPIRVAELRAQLDAIRAGGATAIRLGADLILPGARQASRWFDKPVSPASAERIP